MLDNLKKSNPFKVPENYFENFNSQIMEQLPSKSQEEGKAKVIPLWKKIVPLTAVAAMLLGVVVYTGFLFDKPNSINVSANGEGSYIASVSENDLYQMMEDEIVASTYEDVMYDEMYTK